MYAGGLHTTALKSDDISRDWGWNFRGQLGEDTTTNRSTPVKIMDGVMLPGSR